ncbi:extracellular solute-binding protein [Lactococcus hircilactis]|uniref:extracellular solute-binding protein n=1 Tax=Lactococcus hircilactis TaxID=1494462 RepID=UPI003FA1DD9F
MKTNKVILVGATILATLSLCACGNSSTASDHLNQLTKNAKDVSKTGLPIVKNKLNLSMFAPGSGTSDYSKMAFLKDYSQQTNISFKYTTPPSADIATKLNLALASGDIPGVIFASALSNAQAIQYGGSTLIPLEKYIDAGYMPNLKKILAHYPDVRKSITTPDGHIYTLPALGNEYNLQDSKFAKQPQLYEGSLWFNGAWLKKLNLQVPKTTDQLYTVLYDFKTKDPNGNGKQDEIPLSSTGLPSLRNWIMNAFGVMAQEQQVNQKGKVTYGATTNGYRQYLLFMNKLYSNGLLDKQIFSQSDDQKKAKAAANTLGAYTDWFSYFTSGKTPQQAILDPMAAPMTSDPSKKAAFAATDGITNGAFALTTKCINPVAALRWVDYFYSNAGSQALNIGPDQSKGGYWHWATNKKGEKVHVLNKGIDPANSEQARSAVTPDYGTQPPKVNAQTPLVLANENDPEQPDAFSTFINQEVASKIGPAEVVAWPTLYMSKTQQNELGSTMQTDLLTYVQQMEAKFITGQTKLTAATWKSYLNTLKGIGVDKYVAVQQKAYDTWKNTK